MQLVRGIGPTDWLTENEIKFCQARTFYDFDWYQWQPVETNVDVLSLALILLSKIKFTQFYTIGLDRLFQLGISEVRRKDHVFFLINNRT